VRLLRIVHLQLGTDTILSTVAGTGALTIASATTGTTAPKTTITGSKASADSAGTTVGVRLGAEGRSTMEIDGEGIDINACDQTGGTQGVCADATLKGSGVTVASYSGNVKIQAITGGTVQIKATSAKGTTDDATLLIQAMGTAVSTDARASLKIVSGNDFMGEFKIQQRADIGQYFNYDRFAVDVDGGITVTTADLQPLTFDTDNEGEINLGEIRYRNGYDHTLYKQVDLSTGGTVATVTLQQYQSVFVEIVLEGLFGVFGSIHRGKYLIVHNNGNAPDPQSGGAEFKTSEDYVIATASNTWAVTISTTGGSGTSTIYAIVYSPEGVGGATPSTTMNAIITVRGRFESVT
jgi:hypothetical protein